VVFFQSFSYNRCSFILAGMLKKQKHSCMGEGWDGVGVEGGGGWTAESKILEKLFTLCREGVKWRGGAYAFLDILVTFCAFVALQYHAGDSNR
jgi:hypothetical protein